MMPGLGLDERRDVEEAFHGPANGVEGQGDEAFNDGQRHTTQGSDNGPVFDEHPP